MDNIIINEDKETIKKEINTFCNELYNLEYTGYVSVPVIIIMYLGQDSYSKINGMDKFPLLNTLKSHLKFHLR